MSLEEISRQLRDECKSVGLKHADVVIGLSDGGNGLENSLMNVVSGRAKEIVFIDVDTNRCRLFTAGQFVNLP